jgi:adenylate cyclase
LSQEIESGYFEELNEISGIQILDKEDKLLGKGRDNWLNLLTSCNLRIWIPFHIDENLRGGIGLGDKLSGDPYTPDDQELLSTMARQGVVAVENALLVELMKKEETVRANFARYLSPQIVDQIIKKNVQVNLGGDRKVVTVLFTDVRNFTRIAETLSPEQLVRLLNEYFTDMAEIIFKKRGSLDKYIGDAIVAVFGSLIPLENSCQTAVQAAIQMMKHMAGLNNRWKTKYGLTMNMGIGINTGEVFLGNIGSPDRMEFTVIGDTVNTASRFSRVAQGGQILITKETLPCLDSETKYKELPPIEVKGKTRKVEVFEILY